MTCWRRATSSPAGSGITCWAGARGRDPAPPTVPQWPHPRSNFSAGIARFLGYALGKKDVWAVTMSQLLDWMQHPVPASQMKTFMKKYACP